MSEEKKKELFEIQRIYIKDASFEAPNTPNIFYIDWIPTIKLNLNTSANKIKKNIFEIVLKVNLIAKIKEELVFLCDIDQAGIFFIANLSEKRLNHCLYSYCPNILFPYARACISNLISHGSFPQINLAPINFDALYNNHIKLEKEI
ncbi:preprotein translocase subunit SecB [Buchnera aphidicola str. Ak (Acyrthosiphon kondoi)]|uniref:Protein-export protein SecB n=1 Tax=Buchnera aphidicola str. Ak (Acyrthosiphon kondoi) TaxID=1005090 RepID=G2LMD3_9GAMM|nr:protein-export chaperone SecB [Buchnera aphidicola]AEO08421.1 preprotein translocase subunit SecB [Buchnera aphidicola str. Ak (Acyrthosiphon kondoi)]